MIRVITCLVGKPPKVELIDDPFRYAKDALIGGGYINYRPLLNKVGVMCDEDGDMKKLPYNRLLPGLGPKVSPDIDFIVYMTKQPSARPGELGVYKIRGNFLLVQMDDEKREVNISTENETAYMSWLTNPFTRICKRCGDPLPTPGHLYCGAACSSQAEARL